MKNQFIFQFDDGAWLDIGLCAGAIQILTHYHAVWTLSDVVYYQFRKMLKSFLVDNNYKLSLPEIMLHYNSDLDNFIVVAGASVCIPIKFSRSEMEKFISLLDSINP